MLNIVKTSKCISFLLRHNTDTAKLRLDSEGYAYVLDLCNAVAAEGYYLTPEILAEIVRIDEKQRYSYTTDKTKIRANQGHSNAVNMTFERVYPDFSLYHGTSKTFLDNIMSEGIKPMSRQYVHLSRDIATATLVAKRHGFPVILVLKTTALLQAKVPIYVSDNGVYLIKEIVSPAFIQTTLSVDRY